jgi:hypothetical protein
MALSPYRFYKILNAAAAAVKNSYAFKSPLSRVKVILYLFSGAMTNYPLLYKPTSRPSARICPFIAFSKSALVELGLMANMVSRA